MVSRILFFIVVVCLNLKKKTGQIQGKMLGVVAPCTSLAFIPKAYRFIHFGRSSDLLLYPLPSHSIIMNSDLFYGQILELTAAGTVSEFHRIPF